MASEASAGPESTSTIDVRGRDVVVEDLTSARLLRELVDSTVDYAIFTLDAGGHVATWNAGAERIKGYRADEIIGRHFSAFYTDRDIADGHPQMELRLAAERGRYVEEGWRVRKDGSLLWASVTLLALRDHDGAVTGYGKVTKDVTARHEAELALRESEERLRQLAESMTDAYVLADPAPEDDPEGSGVAGWRIRFAGGNVADVFGLPPGRGLRRGADLLARVHPQDVDRVRGAWSSLAGADARELEFRVLAAGGERWVLGRHRRRESADGTVRLACTFEDISQRRAAHDAVEAARREAQEANRAKNEFLSRMSHELRTPLNAVLGFAQLLQMQDLPAQVAEAVGHIRTSGEHLLGLINEVLDIARIESGRMSLSPEPIALAEIVTEVVDLMRPMSQDAGVSMEAATTAQFVVADRQRLRQVLLNLLSNAVKYNRPQGRVWVRCERATASDAAAAGRVRIVVQDTGIGIAAASMARLFEPFERLGAELTDVEGTGVGLALSQRLTEAMGGSLTATSMQGQGSTFTVDLPAAVPADAGATAGALAAATAAHAHTSTLLYVEDNTANAHLMRAVVGTRPGWTMVHSATGRLAVDLAAADPPGLVLLDLHLPDIPGSEVLARLRSIPALAATPVVIVSADATPRQAERLVAAGAHDYMTKPLDVARLLALLDDLAAAAASGSTLATSGSTHAATRPADDTTGPAPDSGPR